MRWFVDVQWCTICAYLSSPRIRIAVVCRRALYQNGAHHDFYCCPRHINYPLDGIRVRTG